MTYKTIITRLFALKGPVPGYTPDAIAAAERRLGCMLPDVLRDYYLTLGRNKALNATHNRLLEPADIYFSGSGHLVFYEENQAVAVWGIAAVHLAQEDPPVWGAYDMDREEWFEDAGAIDHHEILMLTTDELGQPGSLYIAANNETAYRRIMALNNMIWADRTDSL